MKNIILLALCVVFTFYIILFVLYFAVFPFPLIVFLIPIGSLLLVMLSTVALGWYTSNKYKSTHRKK